MGAAANLKTLREEKREFCLLDVAMIVDDVPGGEDKEVGERTNQVHSKQPRRFAGSSPPINNSTNSPTLLIRLLKPAFAPYSRI